jgi:sporulation protein YlmC with PRC-barrel domain
MNRTLVKGVVCGSTLAILTSLAVAQQQLPPGQNPVNPRGGTAAQRPVPGAMQQMQGGHPLRLSQIIGSTVQSPQAQQLGQIQDVIVDPATGRIEFAILSVSGSGTTQPQPGVTTTTPGSATGRLVPVPWPLFGPSFAAAGAGVGIGTARGTTDQGARTLMLNLDSARLQNAPTVDPNSWMEIQRADFGQRAYSHFGLDWNRRGMGGAGAPGAGVSTGAGTSGARPAPGTTTPPGTGTPGTGTPGTTPPGGTTPPPGGTPTPTPTPRP